MLGAADAIQEFTSAAEYPSGRMQRSAVERQFITIGEATRRITDLEPDIAAGISRRQLIIDFRNVLVHDYRRVRDERVRRIIETGLPELVDDVESLLRADSAE